MGRSVVKERQLDGGDAWLGSMHRARRTRLETRRNCVEEEDGKLKDLKRFHKVMRSEMDVQHKNFWGIDSIQNSGTWKPSGEWSWTTARPYLCMAWLRTTENVLEEDAAETVSIELRVAHLRASNPVLLVQPTDERC